MRPIDPWRGSWQRTPKWHPRRWFGWTWRCKWSFVDWYIHDVKWLYATDAERVTQMLDESVNPQNYSLSRGW